MSKPLALIASAPTTVSWSCELGPAPALEASHDEAWDWED